MEEEDSADELFSKNTSRGKGKRPAASLPSDEDHSDEESEDVEEATDSEGGDGEEEEEEDEQEDVIDDSEDGGDEKEPEGAVGNTSTYPADWLSSDEDAEKCPICLNSFCDQPVATPENCAHYFCLDCIEEWASNANSCPVDRIAFNNILLRKGYGGAVQKTIVVKKKADPQPEEEVGQLMEDTHCEACGGSDREDRMLLCDGCDAGYHMECLTPPLNAVPVEEWFCPHCAPNNRTTGDRRSSEDERSVFPTTSRSQPAQSRPRRAIARTQHSERVRANVNRHRIMQARTAAQVNPPNLVQSTWLDETINAVLTRLNTDGFSRVTTTPRSRRKRTTVRRRRRTKKQGKAAGFKTSNRKGKTRKRRVRRTKRKVVEKKDTTARSRIAQNLGLRNPTRGSSIPSVYRPSDQTLRGMRAEIGAASLSIYGDAAVLSSGDEEESSPLLDVKFRSLSRSALRSHQPVARPIIAGLPRHEHGISPMGVMAEPAPAQDLLGSILSGQTLLLMDSSNVIINRDGSLKPTKHVGLPSVRSSSTGSSVLERTLSSESASTPSSSPFTCPSNSSLPAPIIPAASSPFTPNAPLAQRLVPSKPAGIGQSHRDSCGVRDQPTTKVPNRVSDSCLGERDNTSQQAPAKKLPPKPVWVDVSALPRIPKIKRENTLTNGSTGSNSNTLPESSTTSLAGDKGRRCSVDQQGTSSSQQGRTTNNLTQRTEKAGSSASFSNSFSSSSSVSSMGSNPQSSSAAISFRISSSRNPWHTRRHSVPEPAVPTKDEQSGKKKNKQMLLLATNSKAKMSTVNSVVYDPFDPTGSDSSENESEEDKVNPELNFQRALLSPEREIKTESMDFDSDPSVEEENSGVFKQVKQEPSSPKNDPWFLPSHQSTTHVKSKGLDNIQAYASASSDAECSGTSRIPLTKTVASSRSSSSSSHHGEKMMIKMEVKNEPDFQLSPVKSEPEASQGNGCLDELPSIADSTDRGKDRVKRSPSLLPGSSSQSCSRSSEHSNKKKEHSRSEDRKRSRSRSPVYKESHSKHKERRWSVEQKLSREKRKSGECGRPRDPERSQGQAKARDGERSQELARSPEREHPRERKRSRDPECSQGRAKARDGECSQELRHSPEREHPRERKRSRDPERSKGRAKARDGERSQELGRSPEREHPRERKPSQDPERSHDLAHPPDREHSRDQGHSSDKECLRDQGRPRGRDRSRDHKGLAPSSSSREKKHKHEREQNSTKREHLKEPKKIRKSQSRSRSRSRSRERTNKVLSSTLSSSVFEDREIESTKGTNFSVGDQRQKEDVPEDPQHISPLKVEPSDSIDASMSESCPPDPASVESIKADIGINSLSVEPKEENVEVDLHQTSQTVKQEPMDSSDEDVTVEYLIDSLDFNKKEVKMDSETHPSGALASQSDVSETPIAVKQEPSTTGTGTKTPSQGKRVTWNIQEPEISQPEKMSKLALFKLKLKQEGSRRSSSSASLRASKGVSNPAATSLNAALPEGTSDFAQERSKSCKEVEYLKKLHMQERAIEEVKLAIKPFYQKREITKSEYKEILRKAVQKVCHSKSGEINPVKVANLVKAYVDKYKYDRKHHKDEDSTEKESAKNLNDPQTL